ncbi:MAG: imidazole glycerol-phosphate synthase subunit HisH [Thermodesulfobacteriota bacterium]|nr:imidazole glycerol-phosphate synthase subunit HisH [Thermodesulfobacteriota bacterium]
MIGIINYGLGNIKAFSNIYNRIGIPFLVVTKPDDLKKVTKIILPGVGAFDHAMRLLDKSGIREPLDEIVLNQFLPVLGVCVGMQIMAHSSEEGKLPGLGWIDGMVKKFDSSQLTSTTHLPHMGWNNINLVIKNDLLKNIDSDSRFYFLHSYYFQCQRSEEVLATTDYGGPFASAIQSRNIFGVQFHPEKSHQWGIQILINFAEL